MGAGVLSGVFFFPVDFADLADSFEVLDRSFSRDCGNNLGWVGILGTPSCLAAARGTVWDLFPAMATGICWTLILGEADDHDIGVVVVVEVLQGLGELEKRVDGLLIELTDLLEASACLADDAARACNSGMSLGGRSAGRVAAFVLGMTRPKIAS